MRMLHLALAALLFASAASTAVVEADGGPRSCTADGMCKASRGEVCDLAQSVCMVAQCSQTNKDTACSQYNSTTYCNEQQQCVAQLGADASCPMLKYDYACAPPYACINGKCIEGTTALNNFWNNNRKWIIPIGICMLVALLCCCLCVCWCFRKLCFAGRKAAGFAWGKATAANTNASPANAAPSNVAYSQPASVPPIIAPDQQPYPPAPAQQSYPPAPTYPPPTSDFTSPPYPPTSAPYPGTLASHPPMGENLQAPASLYPQPPSAPPSPAYPPQAPGGGNFIQPTYTGPAASQPSPSTGLYPPVNKI